MKKSEQKRHLRVMRARKNAEKRLLWLKNSKQAIDRQIDAAEARLQCLNDPKWVAEFLEREMDICRSRIESLTTDKKVRQSEIAGMEIELARHKKAAA